MYQRRLQQLLPILWPQLIWLTLILMVARVVMYNSFVEPDLVADKGTI
jgi:hypothetical protein